MSAPQKKTIENKSGIVLFAKRPGKTSFSSLYTIKKALNTSKVGHTGTLDSFASGLLVVCTGQLTRLSSRITSFDKTYEAVISFGQETDTLEPSGKITRQAPLPSLSGLYSALDAFTGNFMQSPPVFSAIRIKGERSSDLARKGIPADIPLRPVSVYKCKLLEVKLENGKIFGTKAEDDDKARSDMVNLCGDEKVLYARILFEVSKGTYIRSLARDIGVFCKSAAHLKGLLRTKVGNFSLSDAAGFSLLPDFSIASVLENEKTLENAHADTADPDAELRLEVTEKLKGMTGELALSCGLVPVKILPEYEDSFYNGRPLKKEMFEKPAQDLNQICGEPLSDGGETSFAVFTEADVFCGTVEAAGHGSGDMGQNCLTYGYVVPRQHGLISKPAS
ncbi:tRNA pseudouridine(55) synthase TruB [Treponema parvum]|uniref:tRNA pseudouridine(55) synthase TruB n=1 Tax=Treponema parvum TaxID=138851 RepID=UPI001AEC665D|nr:tRNA pseudouridine(55) synthase TruB [Treponema parvum]QTQ15875.1 tRNA pseudouridine(55) synthase TruB [Treponema parvum]